MVSVTEKISDEKGEWPLELVTWSPGSLGQEPVQQDSETEAHLQ